jgi:hypothetical protein
MLDSSDGRQYKAKEIPMSDYVELFRTVIERGFNQGDLSVADEVCSTEQFTEHEYLAPTNLG